MNWTNLNTSAATTKIKSGAGFLQGFTVVVPATGTIKLVDTNDTGTLTNLIVGTVAAMALPAAGTNVPLNMHFSQGLVAVMAGAGFEVVLEWY
jgi:hypothetical protein